MRVKRLELFFNPCGETRLGLRDFLIKEAIVKNFLSRFLKRFGAMLKANLDAVRVDFAKELRLVALAAAGGITAALWNTLPILGVILGVTIWIGLQSFAFLVLYHDPKGDQDDL